MTPQNLDHASQLVDVVQVAGLLGVGVRSVIRYVAAGRLPKPLKFGRFNRWRRSDVMAAIG